MKNKNKKNEKKTVNNKFGYTLIEIVIVLLLVAFGFTGSYYLFITSLRADTENRYEIIAGELVQEGLEIVKNKKEENELKWAIWNPLDSGSEPKLNSDIPNNDFNPMVDFGTKVITFYQNVNDFEIQYDLDKGRYVLRNDCSTCVGPVFERRCHQEFDSDEGLLTVDCRISWQSVLLGTGKREVSTRTALTDWER